MSEDMKDAFVCPNCHSDQIQSYELIYAQNVSSSTHTTTGVGISTGGGLGSGLATTSGTSVTALGEAVAPPMMKRSIGSIKEYLLYFVIVAPLILIGQATNSGFFLILTVIAFLGIMYYCHQNKKNTKKWNAEVYPKLLEEWQHCYMCMKCGHSFKV